MWNDLTLYFIKIVREVGFEAQHEPSYDTSHPGHVVQSINSLTKFWVKDAFYIFWYT